MQVKYTYSLMFVISIAAFGYFGLQAAQMSPEDHDLRVAIAKSMLTYNQEVVTASPERELERALAESKKEAELKETHRKEMEELNFQIAIAQSQEDEQLRKCQEAARSNQRAKTAPAALKKEEHTECPICLEPCTKPFKLSCKHTFCRDCIGAHLTTAIQYNKDAFCPMCRTKIDQDNRKKATM